LYGASSQKSLAAGFNGLEKVAVVVMRRVESGFLTANVHACEGAAETDGDDGAQENVAILFAHVAQKPHRG
jgi:hypothetical protein